MKWAGKKKRYQKNVIFHLTPSSKRSITFRCSEFYELPSDLLPKEKEDITRHSRQRILNSLAAFKRIEALSVHAHITTAFCLRVEDKQSKIKKVKKKKDKGEEASATRCRLLSTASIISALLTSVLILI